MKKINQIQSSAVPMPDENIDTDQIIPARFLKATTRHGFGENLFRDWRYDGNNNPNPNFVLNNSLWGGKILLAGKNFGCGSSREHAAWAILDYGFSVVISSSFADIFRNNALNNGLLPVEVSEMFLEKLLHASEMNPHSEIAIDLEQQMITLLITNTSEKFVVPSFKKYCLLNGLDDINYLMSIRKETIQYEQKSKYLEIIS